MVRSALAFVALGLLALFAYFFVKAPEQDNKQRARTAAHQVGETVVEQGEAGLVLARLAAGLGLDGARFLHVHFDNGRALVYGLVPPGVSAETLAAMAREVPGVTTVDVQIVPRPVYLNGAPPAPGPTPANPKPPARP